MRIRPQLIVLTVAALSLGACDVATEMAGDAIKGEIRTQYLAQCEQIAGDVGIMAENISAACECSADEFSADASDGELEVNRVRIEEVLKTCVQPESEEPAAAPAETTNG